MFPHEDGGQSLGELKYKYSIYVFKDNETHRIAERISAPIKSVQTSKGSGSGATEMSMLEIPDELIMTAMKKAQDSDRYIIRLYNPLKKTVTGKINTVFKNPKIVDLNENYEGEFDFDNVHIEPHKIITIEVEK